MAESVSTTSLINYWGDMLQYNRFLMPSAVQVLIQATIDDLKQLQSLVAQREDTDEKA